MSEQGWREFLAADGVDDWVVLHDGGRPVHRGRGFGPVAVTSRCGTQSSTWWNPSIEPATVELDGCPQ